MSVKSDELTPKTDEKPSTISSPGASPLYPESPEATAAQAERARLEAGWRSDLARLEYEIETLRTVLVAKNNQAAELKRRLGITPIAEIKQDLQQGLQNIKESEVYQKTGTALKTFGDYASRKLTDIRNSNAFKSVEDKVGGAYQTVKKSQSVGNLKTRLMRTSASKPEGFENTESASASAGASVATTPELEATAPLPEKVALP